MEYTEEQIKEMLEKAKAEKEAELVAKHNQDMANLRQKNKEEKEKAVEQAKADAKLSAEELAKKQNEEEKLAREKEIAELKAFKKETTLKEKLKTADVPELFVNDRRLINAEDDKVDDVIKTIKEEYEKTLPNGARVSTNVNNRTDNKTDNDEFADFRKAGVGGKK